MCLAALLCEQFLPFREWRYQDIDQVFMVISVSVVISGKNVSTQSKLLPAACWSREKREEGVKPTCFRSKATSVTQANHSQYSSHVEA